MAQQFHKFRAESLEQAYRAMRRKLGEDALVVRTTTVAEGGVMGIGSKRLYEVTAAAPTRNPAARRLSSVEKKYRRVQQSDADLPSLNTAPDAQPPTRPREFMGDTRKGLEYFEKLVRDAQERIGAPKTPSIPSTSSGVDDPDAFQPLSELKRETISKRTVPKPAASSAPLSSPPLANEADLRAEIAQMRDMIQVLVAESAPGGAPKEHGPYYQALLDSGVTRELAARLVTGTADCADPSILSEERVFVERLKLQIRGLFRTTGGIKLGPGPAHVVALVGPTGVGKTTNLAKLAAAFAVSEHAKVGLITADTYRVAATDQLRVYANIIGLDMKIVKNAEQATAAREEFSAHDLVLVDTAGSSPFNEDQMEGVQGILEAVRPDETFLVMSAGTSLEDLRSIYSRFDVLRPSALLFSKLDETRRYGAMLSLVAEAALPLSYFSIGQNVPDDIVLAHAGMVADLALDNGDGGGRASTKTA